MELFTPRSDGQNLRARIILHLADFTNDVLLIPDDVDTDLLESLARAIATTDVM